MRLRHAALALVAVSGRELVKFVHQRGRLFSALVRPALWLVVFAAGFQNVFGVSIIPPYDTYIEYQVYIVPGLLGMVLLFNGMQSSLAMVYDREMGIMRLLLTAPLPRWYLLFSKLLAGTALSVLQAYAFLALCAAFRVENFAGTMNFVIFPMFFLSTALYPLWKLQESGAEVVYQIARINPFTHAVELVRYALYGQFNGTSCAVVGAALAVFFVASVLGYDPQRGLVQRVKRPA